jgi:hypothetical protein
LYQQRELCVDKGNDKVERINRSQFDPMASSTTIIRNLPGGGIEISLCRGGLFISLDSVLARLPSSSSSSSSSSLSSSTTSLAIKSLVRIAHDRLWRILYDLHRGPEGRAHGSIDEMHVLLTRFGGVSLLSNLDSESDSNNERGSRDMFQLGSLLWRIASRTSVPIAPPLPACDSLDRDLYRVVELLLFEPHVCFSILLTGAKSSSDRDIPSFSVGLLTAEEIDEALASSSASSSPSPPTSSSQTKIQKQYKDKKVNVSPPTTTTTATTTTRQQQQQKQLPHPPPPPPQQQRLQSNEPSRRATSGKAIARSPTISEVGGNAASPNHSVIIPSSSSSSSSSSSTFSSLFAAPAAAAPTTLSLRDRLRQEAADRAAKEREEELLAARIAAHNDRLALQQKSKELLFEPSKPEQGSVVHNLARTLVMPPQHQTIPTASSNSGINTSSTQPRSESPLLANPPSRKGMKAMLQEADREAEERLLTNARIAAHAERLALKEKYGR